MTTSVDSHVRDVALNTMSLISVRVTVSRASVQLEVVMLQYSLHCFQLKLQVRVTPPVEHYHDDQFVSQSP
jgi:hypothetical protein